MQHIFYEEFDRLLSEYRNATSREEKLIKHKLDSIVALYENCSVEELEFADEITLEFSRIIALLKKQHKKEITELTDKYRDSADRQESASFNKKESAYVRDSDVLADFYDYFKGAEYPLYYWQIEDYVFESDEDRKKKVNLTMWDYCNRIKTFANKYLYEIYPEEAIPSVIHGEGADTYETYENVVFAYNHLEMILAKIKTTNEEGKTVKQRLNIRSALRKLNKFKQETQRNR